MSTSSLPLVWLLGKVQSGKSSIVRALTQQSVIEIGDGFKPCTKSSAIFDFPAHEPIIRFMDTRGIGETGYDATEDVKFAAASSHLIIAAVRVMDVQQAAVVRILADVRRNDPNCPIIVAMTNLHEGYAAGATHIVPYPFTSKGATLTLPSDMRRCIDYHTQSFTRLPGNGPVIVTPIDLTQPGDGYEPRDYGIDALIDGMLDVAPAALAAAVAALPVSPLSHDPSRSSSVILQHAAMAAGADVVPLAGLVAVPAVQARMLQKLADLHGVIWDRRAATEFAAALGSTVAIRALVASGVRQLSRLVPIYGQTVAVAASSASSFAITYAVGVAARRFLTQRRRGKVHPDDIAAAYREALREAFNVSQKMKHKRTADHA